MAYCNITTDLKDVCSDIGNFVSNNILEGWQLAASQTNTYFIAFIGYIEKVYDDGRVLTVKTSIADTESNAGSYYHDSTNGILYVHGFDSDDLTSNSAPTIEEGVAFATIATRAVNEASEEIDSYLNNKYPTPLLSRWNQHHVDSNYPTPIRKACAMLACRNIILRDDPNSEVGKAIERQALNFDPEPGDEKGIIPKIIDGTIQLQDQETSKREIGHYNIFPDSGNAGTGYIRLSGTYVGSEKQDWLLEIDAEGVPGTVTWKLAYDGTNFDKELQETLDTNDDNRRIHLAYGVYCEFQGTFAAEDKWTIEVFPVSDEATPMISRSIEMVR